MFWENRKTWFPSSLLFLCCPYYVSFSKTLKSTEVKIGTLALYLALVGKF